jgi:hypothetical protein
MRILRNAFLAVGLMAIAGACGGGQKEAAEPAPEAEPAAEQPAEGMPEEGAGEEGMPEEGAAEEGGEGGEGGEW